VNKAALWIGLGELGRAFDLQAEARGQLAQRYGLTRGTLWLERELAAECYLTGRWDEAVRIVDRCLDKKAEPHYLDGFCAIARGQIRLARGDLAGALVDAEWALGQAHEAKDAQCSIRRLRSPPRSWCARREQERANELVDELLALLTGEELLTTCIAWPRLARIAGPLGREHALLAALRRVRTRTLWIDAAELQLSGRADAAAALYAAIGSRPDEAYAWLAAGDRGQALAFFEEVGGAGEVEAARSRALQAEPPLECAVALQLEPHRADGRLAAVDGPPAEVFRERKIEPPFPAGIRKPFPAFGGSPAGCQGCFRRSHTSKRCRRRPRTYRRLLAACRAHRAPSPTPPFP
jgi:tetratricopeptide (TPR) repeat protein